MRDGMQTYLSIAKDGAIVPCQQAFGYFMCAGGIDTVLTSTFEDTIELQHSCMIAEELKDMPS